MSHVHAIPPKREARARGLGAPLQIWERSETCQPVQTSNLQDSLEGKTGKCQKKKKNPSCAPKLIPDESTLYRNHLVLYHQSSSPGCRTDDNPFRFNATAMCNDTHSSSQRQVVGPFTLIHMNIMPTAMQHINIFRANSLTFIALVFLIILICFFSILLLFHFTSKQDKKYSAANTSVFNGLKNNEGTLSSSRAFRSIGIFKDEIDQRGCEL